SRRSTAASWPTTAWPISSRSFWNQAGPVIMETKGKGWRREAGARLTRRRGISFPKRKRGGHGFTNSNRRKAGGGRRACRRRRGALCPRRGARRPEDQQDQFDSLAAPPAYRHRGALSARTLTGRKP